MVYSISLKIDGKKTNFKVTKTPMFLEITKATIAREHQMQMYSKDEGPSEKDFMRNMDLLSEFASLFWNNQFEAENVTTGADLKAIESINKAILSCIGVEEDSNDTESKK
ncbi:phage tail assembly chaperone G [Companilactobacillus paralimentarius]|uniref:phage tail assembly chaperone G n=1 Tax=Companilactobacillus paralimentarius TaxID=83526 RepID=UPI00384C7F3F